MTEQPIRYPGAVWRPLGTQTQPEMERHDVICLHTMVGSLHGTDAMFMQGGYRGTESHFGVGGNGQVLQWQDLRYTADANYQGGERVISIETADHGPEWAPWAGSDVPAWTPAQLDALARLVMWLSSRFGIPLELIPDSRPGRRGVGYHRQGVDPFRVPGGELWSKAHGKVCPGDRRIAQIPGIITAARHLRAGAAAPAPPTTEDDVMQPITLAYFDDEGRPDPAGLAFRGACPVEQGQSGMGPVRSWVRWVSYWGAVESWRIVFWSATQPIGEVAAPTDPSRRDNYACPPGTRGLTVEGRRGDAGVQPAAALITWVDR